MYYFLQKVKFFIAVFICLPSILLAQFGNFSAEHKALQKTNRKNYSPSNYFIENIGQYGTTLNGYEYMGKILFAYEEFDMPVLFTEKGVIHLQRKITDLKEREKEKLEKEGLIEAEIEKKKNISDKIIALEWIGANNNLVVETETKSNNYYTYGLIAKQAFGYKKITIKEIYSGIDIVYSFDESGKIGYEYSFIIKPGADISQIKGLYKGDIKKIKTNYGGEIVIKTGIETVTTSVPKSFYGKDILQKNLNNVETNFTLDDNVISFDLPNGYDKTQTLVIDPFVTSTSALTGVNAGKAKDIDFDYAGNIYITGGGSGTQHQLAKYNSAGVLQWTYNGSLTIPTWTYGAYYGGFVVDKNTGACYLGQGFAPTAGYRVVRISTTGLYDNYISNGNVNFNENWSMYWNCNSGSPQIMIVGGGTSSNLNLGILSPPSTSVTSINLTGISTVCQDMVCMALDPVNFDMYTLFASEFITPVINNKIYKNAQPYSAASIVWNVPSGYTVVHEANNRPYLSSAGFTLQDNSANVLAINASYLFYWDGKNLRAYNKATGTPVGSALTTSNTTLMQGGIVADACNNIFIGESNGIIKAYNFNGTTFDDLAVDDITIPGFSGKSVYDLAYDESKKIIYACGDGFVASFNITGNCNSSSYTINVATNCVTGSATATLTPAPPGGSTITYALYNGTTLITTNTTGIFTGLQPNITYSITATVNLLCSGTQIVKTFIIAGPSISATVTNTTCGNNTGAINATATGASPFTYSINGTTFFPTGVFNTLSAGVYTVTVKDVNNCPNTTQVVITNINGPLLTYTNTNAICGATTGSITANATAGTAPYLYSINGGASYQSNNFFPGLAPGNYNLVVKDFNGCTNAVIATINGGASPNITAIPASASCGNNNGTITAFGSGGTAPLQYSINGSIYQTSNIFTSIGPGTYTVYVKDAYNCVASVSVTVVNSAPPTISGTTTGTACSNTNGTITINSTGGIAPLQYSINNGVTYQPSNIFTGLAAGVYTITVKDATNCTNTTNVTVNNTSGGPTVTATSTAASCNASDGSITVTASGTAPFQYSIDGGATYQASNFFTGLAAANYIVLVKDNVGCVSGVNIIVPTVAGPSLTATTTPSSCTVNDGTITANASGGATPYSYSIDGVTYQAGNIFNGLASNNYTVYVKDFNNCIKSVSVFVGNASGLSLTVSTINSTCTSNNGTITATASGGIGALQYSINGTTYQASNIFTGLAPSTYTVYVKDVNNCIVTKQAIVGSLTGPSLTTSIINATCSQANGVIRVTGSGGVAPLQYSINGTTYQSSNVFLNIAAGTYTVYVKDANNCIATNIVTVTSAGSGTVINTFTVVTKYYPCDGDVAGKITNPRVNGANCGTCTFELDFSGTFIPNATQLFLGVVPGIHYVTAKNASGCTKTIQVNMLPTALATVSTVVTATACNTTNGSIAVTGIGPNTPYHVSINGGGTWVTFDPSFTFTGLAPGVYYVISADDASFTTPPDNPGGCLDTVIVTVPLIGAGPSITTIKTSGTCGGSNGVITATGSGGAGGYTYNIDNGAYQASGIFSGLASGIHITTVKDASGCVAAKRDTLSNGTSPSFNAVTTQTTCGLINGTITITVNGGVPPYQYSSNGTTFQSSNVLTGLANGTYSVYVLDNVGCYTVQVITITSRALPSVTASAVAASCGATDGMIIATGSSGLAPYQYSINGTIFQSSNIFTNLAAGFYTVTIKDASDCATTTGVSIPNLNGPSLTSTQTSSTCGNPNGSITITAAGGTPTYQYSLDGITFQPGNVFNSLLAGTYTITVKDLNNCIATRTVTLGNIPGPRTLTATIVNASCNLNNGSITASATGGTGTLQYSINGTTYQSPTLFSGLAPNTYTLYVKDANNCVRTLTPVDVINLASPTLSLSATDASCGLNNGTITATAAGGTGILEYSRNGVTYQSSNVFTGLAAGSYIIYVRDVKLCITASNIIVGIAPFNGTLAGLVGGSQACGSAIVAATGTSYYDPGCNLIARVIPNGATPVNGNINSCVIIDNSVQTFNAEPYVQRHYDIEPAVNASNATSNIVLYFKDAEFVEFNLNRASFPALPTVAGGGNSDPNIANLRVTQYHGIPIAPHNVGNPAPGFYSVPGGVLITPTSVNYNSVNNYWEVTFPVSGFSGFYVHTNIRFALKITIDYFKGQKQSINKNLLQWQLACTGKLNGKVILEKSIDGVRYNSIQSSIIDSSKCSSLFNYTDDNVAPTINYYRLKISNTDGSYYYSNVVAIDNNATSKDFELVNVVPNPVTTNTLSINIYSNKIVKVQLKITTTSGKTILQTVKAVNKGLNTIQIILPNLASGIYMVSAFSEKHKATAIKFLKN